MTSLSTEDRARLRELLTEVLRFTSWAVGEGIAPAEGDPTLDPGDILMAYSEASGDDDWDTLPDRLPAQLLDLLDAQDRRIQQLEERVRQNDALHTQLTPFPRAAMHQEDGASATEKTNGR